MFKCPYCHEALEEKILRCPFCQQFLIDDILVSDFNSVDKKRCFFCGKKILAEAKICRYCQKWLDEVDQRANDVDLDDLV